MRSNAHKLGVFLMVLLGLLCLSEIIRTAWLSDDAYITLRSVDNLLQGYGLRWNSLERVQTFTHPLWMLLITICYRFSSEHFFTLLGLSMLTSALSLALFCVFSWRRPALAVLCILVLCFSKAFLDYSSSGLENPLTHLLLVLTAFVAFGDSSNPRRVFLISLLSALCMLNRVDCALLLAPLLLLEWQKFGWRKSAGIALLGFLPLLLWEVFSLLYYGLLLPNTAYAKLNTALPRLDLIIQGAYFFLDSLLHDPLTLLACFSALFFSFKSQNPKSKALALGVVLYLLYVLWIGGDFMRGRFFSAPLLLSLCALSSSGIVMNKMRFSIASLAILLLGFATPYPAFISAPCYGADPQSWLGLKGVADERAFYCRWAALSKPNPALHFKESPRAAAGKAARKVEGPLIRQAIGFFSFFAGPELHVVDPLALSDAFLARLPARRDLPQRSGHYLRSIPKGYLQSLQSGESKLEDPKLQELFNDVLAVSREPLFSLKRLSAAWRLNNPWHYDFSRMQDLLHPKLDQAEIRNITTKPTVIPQQGLIVKLPFAVQIKGFRLQLPKNASFRVDLMLDSVGIATELIEASDPGDSSFAPHLISPDPESSKKKINRIRMVPLEGDGKYRLQGIELIASDPE